MTSMVIRRCRETGIMINVNDDAPAEESSDRIVVRVNYRYVVTFSTRLRALLVFQCGARKKK